MTSVLRIRADGAEPRRATVVLTNAQQRMAPAPPDIEFTGLESHREAKAKLKAKKLLAKKIRPGSAAGTHFVQGGLPELGRRR